MIPPAMRNAQCMSTSVSVHHPGIPGRLILEWATAAEQAAVMRCPARWSAPATTPLRWSRIETTDVRDADQVGGVNRPSTAVQPPSTMSVEPVT
jgi:hypothetical protein